MKPGRPVIVSNGVPYLQMRSVGSHTTSGREKEGKRKEKGKDRVGIGVKWLWIIFPHLILKFQQTGQKSAVEKPLSNLQAELNKFISTMMEYGNVNYCKTRLLRQRGKLRQLYYHACFLRTNWLFSVFSVIHLFLLLRVSLLSLLLFFCFYYYYYYL